MVFGIQSVAKQKAAYEQRFFENKNDNLFWGDFGSLDEARAHIPAALAAGYDHAEGAKALYSHQIYNWDYPGLFWVGQAIAAGATRILDLGGHVGIKFYAFRRVINMPPALQWCVCDVPAVAEAGRALAAERGVAAQLSFVTDFRAFADTDVLYISGALQYLPTTMAQLLAELPSKPQRIILNTTAMHEDRTICTLNSIGFGVCPYRIEHHEQVQKALVEAGYRRRDGWRNEGKPIEVPFVEGGDRAYYGGGCFDRA